MSTRRKILLDVAKCTGCRLCEAMCSFVHEGEFNPVKSRIKVVRTVERQLLHSNPVLCLQCRKAYCSDACSEKAITRNAHGTLIVDEDKCIGCGQCETRCPAGAIILDPDKGIAAKCDLCAGLGEPHCVQFCYAGALKYVEAEKAGMTLARAKLDKFTELEWRA